MSLNPSEIAQVVHEANRALQRINGEVVNLPWENLSIEMRESTEAGVRAALEGATPEELHQQWCETREAQGWTYGPVKDFARKEHPCLVAYEDLPWEQRIKDSLLGAISTILG
jgi:hypothetical protein